MNNRKKFKKLGYVSLLLSLITYCYVAWDDLKGKYFLSEGDYVQAEGEIVYSAVEGKRVKHEKINYYPSVRYEFFVKGKRYFSDRIHFSHTAKNSSLEAEKALQKYPLNKRVIVFYEQGSPNFSVLEPYNYNKGDEIVVLLCIVWGVIVTSLYNWHESRKRRRWKYS